MITWYLLFHIVLCCGKAVKCYQLTCSEHSLILQGIELAVELHVIPLIGGDLVAAGHGGESVEEVGAQAGVDIIGHVDGGRGTVLCPVGEVA